MNPHASPFSSGTPMYEKALRAERPSGRSSRLCTFFTKCLKAMRVFAVLFEGLGPHWLQTNSEDAMIQNMPFPRAVVFEACTFLGNAIGYHGEFEDMVLRWELDQFEVRNGQAVHHRFRNLFRYLRDNPEATHDRRPLWILVVEEAARHVSPYHPGDEFVRTLERAGYLIENGQLRRTLPEALDLPAADDELHILLDHYDLETPLGHLDQAITAHGRGDWAAANSQIRSFLESLLDEIAYILLPNAHRGQNQGEARREALANFHPPFLSLDLNEWGNQGRNLVNGVFKRLHPQGAHPGLSDNEDSTFRLHLVLLLGRLFMRRLDALRGGRP